MNWILILSMFAGSTDGGSTIHSVDGFSSREQCLAAANAWLRSRPTYANGEQVRAAAACVQRGAK